MNYLHSKTPPMVHRDLKCQSILLTPNFDAKVGDFGFAQAQDSARRCAVCCNIGLAPRPAEERDWSCCGSVM